MNFTFPQETPRFKCLAGGALVAAGMFPAGSRVEVAEAAERWFPGARKKLAFGVWIDGSPHYFDPVAAGISPKRLEELVTELRTHGVSPAR